MCTGTQEGAKLKKEKLVRLVLEPCCFGQCSRLRAGAQSSSHSGSRFSRDTGAAHSTYIKVIEKMAC
jgi:hypothetical protein